MRLVVVLNIIHLLLLECMTTCVFQVREKVDKYARIFVFSIEHMRNSKLKDLRDEWKGSRYAKTSY